jgi:hypothetical protein
MASVWDMLTSSTSISSVLKMSRIA